MKLKISEKNKKDFRQVNFYQKESEKKSDTKSEKFLNFKIEKKYNLRKYILLVRSVVKRAKTHKEEKISFFIENIKNIPTENISDFEKIKIFSENLFIGEYKFDRYLSKKKGRISEIIIFGNFSMLDKKAIQEGQKVSAAVNFARDLANTPGGDMTPTVLANAVKKEFAKNKEVKVKILEDKQTEKLKMGLYNSVGKGSEEKSKFIICEYLQGKKNEKPIVLIGKGITFDTGGNNIKVGPHMLGMHMDMTGGATVIGALKAIADLKIKKNVIVLVPAAENSASGSATRPGDIIKSMAGKTVEIKNTDAEGRLVLADAITYAKKYSPKYVIDVATLTGAALMAVGQRASVVMSNNLEMENSIRGIGEQTGDYFWPLPLWEEYLENMKTAHADLSNLSDVSWGGTITAGIFLNEFAKDLKTKWAHLDIAPRMESIPTDTLEVGATGEPVRMMLEFVKQS